MICSTSDKERAADHSAPKLARRFDKCCDEDTDTSAPVPGCAVMLGSGIIAGMSLAGWISCSAGFERVRASAISYQDHHMFYPDRRCD